MKTLIASFAGATRVASRALAVAGLLVVATGAIAAQRTFVASNGNDAANCSRPTPCRQFSAALAQTDAAGEIIVVDSAGYGEVTIGKSVSIVAPPGVYAGISVFNTAGVTINGAGVQVTLRGLTINGQGGSYGIKFEQGSQITIDRCVVTNTANDGIRLETGKATITNTTVRGVTQRGIAMLAGTTMILSDSEIEYNGGNGVDMLDNTIASIVRTMVAGNAFSGVSALGGTGGSRLTITNSFIADQSSYDAVTVSSSATRSAYLVVSGSTLTRNSNGINVNAGGGVLYGNATDNQISNQLNSGILSTGAGTSVRAWRNGVFRNYYGMYILTSGIIYSPGNNYVRDNLIDNLTVTADSLL